MKHKIEHFSMKIEKTIANGRKKNPISSKQ
jgi:hypothetical protein